MSYVYGPRESKTLFYVNCFPPRTAHICWHHQIFLALLPLASPGTSQVLKLMGLMPDGFKGQLSLLGPK